MINLVLDVSVEIANEVERLPGAEEIKRFVDKREDEEDLKEMAEGQYKSVVEVRGDNEPQLVRSIGRTGYNNNTCGFRELLDETIEIKNPRSQKRLDYLMLFGKYVAKR